MEVVCCAIFLAKSKCHKVSKYILTSFIMGSPLNSSIPGNVIINKTPQLTCPHCVLLELYYSVDFPWWFHRKIIKQISAETEVVCRAIFLVKSKCHKVNVIIDKTPPTYLSTLSPSGTLLFGGLPMMIWQKNLQTYISGNKSGSPSNFSREIKGPFILQPLF